MGEFRTHDDSTEGSQSETGCLQHGIDNDCIDNRYISLPDHFYTLQPPERKRGTCLLDVSPECRELLGMSSDMPSNEALRSLLGGESLWPGMQPLAQKYTGHQFGVYNPALGDGRGLLLGEWRTPEGDHFDLHLKGAGETPYSRHADGQAVLRSTVREYLASEALAALGIPTTRALALARNDVKVRRESWETGATLLRVSPSHIRFGHFEWLCHAGKTDDLRRLVDFVIEHYFPEVREADSPTLAMFERVVELTAEMIAAWQSFGFVHGVMNTDNMSILGLTFDYGPYAFQDIFDPGFNPNHSDMNGRYSYDAQPSVGMWNLGCLATALLPVVIMERGSEQSAREALGQVLETYGVLVNQRYGERMRARLGLMHERVEDPALLSDFLSLLARERRDYHCSFRCLSDWNTFGSNDQITQQLGNSPMVIEWLKRYAQRLQWEDTTFEQRKQQMDSVNPLYILRTHLAQKAIEALEEHDATELKRLRNVLGQPFTIQAGMQHYAKPAPFGAAVCLSCSS